VDNWSDALEYVQAHAAPPFASLLGLLPGYGYALYRIRHLRLRVSRAYGLVARVQVSGAASASVFRTRPAAPAL
jgi:hypothetical protein